MALEVVVGSKSSHDIKNRPSNNEKRDVHVGQMKVLYATTEYIECILYNSRTMMAVDRHDDVDIPVACIWRTSSRDLEC